MLLHRTRVHITSVRTHARMHAHAHIHAHAGTHTPQANAQRCSGNTLRIKHRCDAITEPKDESEADVLLAAEAC